MRRITLLALGLFATPLFAQYWAHPAKTPNTDVKCTGCFEKANGQMTPGYPASIGTYVGRYLDSSPSNDCQQPIRTFRAVNVLPMPALNAPHGRLYFQIGSSLQAFDIDNFFQRVGRGESLANNTGSVQCRPQIVNDTALSYDSWFYAESQGSGWDVSSGGDGQTRLYWLDADDQGYVYLATKWYRWGIVKDDFGRGGSNMGFVSQSAATSDDVIPIMVVSLKASNGTYYAAIGDRISTKMNLYDVTDRSNPRKVSNLSKSIYQYAKNGDGSAIGVATVDGRFEIYRTDTFVANGSPLVSDGGPGGAPVRAVGSDGVNFYVAADASGGLVITTYAPNGGGYQKVKQFTTARATLATESLKWGDGYLVQAGITDGGYELRLFKATVNDVSEVDVSIPALPGNHAYYFKNYYVINTSGRSGYVGAGLFGQFHDSTVVKNNGHTYLIVTAFGLGDVYELPGADSLSIQSAGSVGTPNPNRPPGGGAGPFYGDPVGFTATTASAATNIQWNFGNAEAVAGADPNVVTGVTGQQTTHRYSGLTSAASLPTTRTVTAASLTNANLNGSLAVTLAKPSVAIGIAGGSTLITQASQLASIPIVAGDNFVDASDGSVESHFDTWSIDGNAANALPSGSVSAGACAAAHTLNFDAHYGPYSAFLSLSDMPIGIHGAAYSVRPFAASVATAPSANSIAFTASVRTTSDTTILTAAQAAALQYRWQLVDAGGNVLVQGPTGSGAVPQFTVAKSAFSSRGIRARLTLTSPTPAGGACAGLGLESLDAYTQPLNGPDPVVNGGCTNGGSPCSFSVASASGVDPAADGWTYAWSVQPPSFRGATTGATFAPVFTAVGAYTVNATVTNGIGSSTASKSVTVTTVPPPCPQMLPGVNVFVSYQSASGSCSFVGGSCSIGDLITFTGSGFNYDFGCDTHTFTWDFGDGTQDSGQTRSHSYGAAGTYNVSLTISNHSETVTTTVAVKVGQVACLTMVPGQNVFAAFSGASGCTSINTTPCIASESINFAAGASAYDFSCAEHTFQWSFGDNTSATTKNINIQHVYAAPGTYLATLKVTNSTQSITTTVPVKVATKKGCTNLGPSSFFVAYSGLKSQCSYVSSDSVCSNLEDVSFNAAPDLGFDASCVTGFEWDFGDGSSKVAGQAAAHKFAAAGKYNVKVAVTDGTSTVTYTAAVSVRDENPIVDCIFDFTISPHVVNGITQANEFEFRAAGAGGGTAASYEWDFGDGTHTTSTTPLVTHAYSEATPHVVTLTVPGTNCRVQHTAVTPRRRAAGH
jgi:PKD repeat protein